MQSNRAQVPHTSSKQKAKNITNLHQPEHLNTNLSNHGTWAPLVSSTRNLRRKGPRPGRNASGILATRTHDAASRAGVCIVAAAAHPRQWAPPGMQLRGGPENPTFVGGWLRASGLGLLTRRCLCIRATEFCFRVFCWHPTSHSAAGSLSASV